MVSFPIINSQEGTQALMVSHIVKESRVEDAENDTDSIKRGL